MRIAEFRESSDPFELNSCLKIQMNFTELYDNSVRNIHWEEYLKGTLLPAAEAYLRVLLKPKKAVTLSNGFPLNPISNVGCGKYAVYFDPSYGLNPKWDADSDFFVLLQIWDQTSVRNASLEKANMFAISCLRSVDHFRPLGGIIGINVENLKLPWKSDLEKNEKYAIIQHEKNLYILLHEFMDLFAFTDDHFQHFVDQNGIKKNYAPALQQFDNTFWVKVWPFPKHTQYLRDHFNCPIFSAGAFIDAVNQTQFVNKIYGPEIMNTVEMLNQRISNFTLTILDDSGWWEVDYTYANYFR